MIQFFVGIVFGVVGLTLFWYWRVHDPKVARGMLTQAYARSHAHWCHVAEDNDEPACPCCGWSPGRRAQARIEVAKQDLQ